MKRWIVVAAIVSVSALAQTGKAPTKNKGLIGNAVEAQEQVPGAYGMSGCGLGSVLFGEAESKVGQVLAVTTNNYASNNTFGISSGTSNCVPDKAHTAQVRKNMQLFVTANREALANDIVKSQGETIASISEIMGCKDVNYLGATLQSRYETIFNSKEDVKVADNMFNTVSSDRYLLESCKL
ncbi:MAG: DUF3015 family protein [Bacteriovoracaceae bacterium]